MPPCPPSHPAGVRGLRWLHNRRERGHEALTHVSQGAKVALVELHSCFVHAFDPWASAPGGLATVVHVGVASLARVHTHECLPLPGCPPQVALSLRLVVAKALRRIGRLDEAETHFKVLAGERAGSQTRTLACPGR